MPIILINLQRNSPSVIISNQNVIIEVNTTKIIGTNKLSLGIMIGSDLKAINAFLTNEVLQEKAAECNFQLVRLFDFVLQPCKSWDDERLTGTFDWSTFDTVIQSIYDIGAEPLLCIGRIPDNETGWGLPLGMAIDPVTKLPSTTSYGAYSSELVRQVRDRGWFIKYWEIWNEPEHYFFSRDDRGNTIWGHVNETRVKNFLNLYNNATQRMLEIEPGLLIGTDASLYRGFFDRYILEAKEIGFLSYHRYDAWGTWLHEPEGYLKDEEILRKAEQAESEYRYSPGEARLLWRGTHGFDVPIICTETNLNGNFINGTDPRIQEPVGGLWYALRLMTDVMNDVKSSIYYCFVSDDSLMWDTLKPTRGAGFGMINTTSPNEEWYPFFVNRLIGNHLAPGDVIYDGESSNSSRISMLCWRHGDELKVLLAHKLKDRLTKAEFRFYGLELDPDTEVAIHRINGSKEGASHETTLWSNADPITLEDYSLLLLTIKL